MIISLQQFNKSKMTTANSERQETVRKTKLSHWMVLIFAPIILFACDQAKPVGAIFNCLTPNMFKLGKGNQPFAGAGYGGAERSNWYPQQPFYPSPIGYPGYGQNPMKMLFQPKWKGGSLFGSKGWNNWKMGASSNFYRPGFGYGPSISSPTHGYPFNEQLNVAPFTVPPISSYGSSASNDGWSVPLTYSAPIQQAPITTTYDSGYTQPAANLIQPIKQVVVDPYSGTKGASGTASGIGNKYSSTTKNILVADGGYSVYDAYLTGGLRNRSYGYAYPEWYSGVVDSPARIAQQLLKSGLKRPRLHPNRSAPLLQGTLDTKFTILDEPRFVGFGTVEALNNREARLSCSFNEAVDQTYRPVWIKFSGPYNVSRVLNTRIVPPFNCANSLCRTQEVESTKDYRYRFDNGPATSTLIISEPRLSDYGIYRCSALTNTINNNPLETIYQIIRFGDLK